MHKDRYDVKIFCIIMLLGMGLSLVLNFIFESYFLGEQLFYDKADVGMDFFNSISINAFGKRTPYTEGPTSYPPLAVAFFYFCSRLFPEELIQLEGKALRTSQQPSAVFYILIILSAVIIFLLCEQLIEGSGRTKKIFAGLCVFTTGALYAFERGNIIILAFIFTLLFFVGNQSESFWVREGALVCLAIAAGIKIYPAVFGILLIVDREYKRAFRAVIYGIVIFFAPFWFFEGREAIPIFIRTLIGFSEKGSIIMELGGVNFTGILNTLFLLFRTDYSFSLPYIQKIGYICAGIGIFCTFTNQSRWKKVAILTLLTILVPGFSGEYGLIFMIIPLIMFLNEKDQGKLKGIYFVLFALIVIPWPIKSWTYLKQLIINQQVPLTGSQFLWQISLLIFFFVLLIDMLVNTVKKLRSHNTRSLEKIILYVIFFSVAGMLAIGSFYVRTGYKRTRETYVEDMKKSAEKLLLDTDNIVYISGLFREFYIVNKGENNELDIKTDIKLEEFLENYEGDILVSRAWVDQMSLEKEKDTWNLFSEKYTMISMDESWFGMKFDENKMLSPCSYPVLYEEGFYGEEQTDIIDEPFRWSQKESRFSIINSSRREQRVKLSFRTLILEANSIDNITVVVNGKQQTYVVTGEEAYTHELELNLKPGVNEIEISTTANRYIEDMSRELYFIMTLPIVG